MSKNIRTTERGFNILELKDSNKRQYDLQESSVADGTFIWIFTYGEDGQRDKGAIHLDAKDAFILCRELQNYFVDHSFEDK